MLWYTLPKSVLTVPNHIYASHMPGNCFHEPYTRSNTVEKASEVFLFSQHKTKGLFIEIDNWFKHIIFSMRFLFRWCKTLPQDAKPCVPTGREDACLVPCAKGCRAWPCANTASGQEVSVHCSASCPPFFRMERNKREGMFIPVDPLRYTALPCKKLSTICVQVQSIITLLLFDVNAVFEPSAR